MTNKAIRSVGEAKNGDAAQEFARAPFPYFGGKTHCSGLIWRALGDPTSYVEPFAGSLGALLQRPSYPFAGTKRREIVNDLDGFISNFWRAIKADPAAVAAACDFPVIETDLRARHYWLVTEGRARLELTNGDPDAYDAKIAGWWAWGLSSWFGSGWCAGNGPWIWAGTSWEKMPQNRAKRPHVGDFGQGVNAQRPHVGDFGQGVNAKRPHVGDFGQGKHLAEWFNWLALRLRGVSVFCGDWSRCVSSSALGAKMGSVAVFLDPPYADTANRAPELYSTDSLSVAHDVRRWCLESPDATGCKIALCGLEGEHDMPESWTACAWKFKPGQNNHTTGYGRERIWFSPECGLTIDQANQSSLFDSP